MSWYGEDGLKTKLVEGIEWRGETTLDVDGDEIEVTYRQLYDREESKYRERIDLSPFKKARDNLDDDQLERLRELSDVEDPSDEEEAEMEDLQAEAGLTEDELASITEGESADALIEVAKCGIMPTQDDVDYAWNQPESWKREQLGENPKHKGDLRDLIKEKDMKPKLDKATNHAAISLGLRVYLDTLSGN